MAAISRPISSAAAHAAPAAATISGKLKSPDEPNVEGALKGAYDLSVNNLDSIARYEPAPGAGISLRSKVSLPAGSHFCYITSHEPQPKPTWKTIQTSETTHTDPQSALLYMNHSCAPTLELHMTTPDSNRLYPKRSEHHPHGVAGEVKVSKDRGIAEGDELTFFYPSTEWQFDRPFDCVCGSKDCVGMVTGAKGLNRQVLEGYYVNDHIWRMKNGQQGVSNGANGHA